MAPLRHTTKDGRRNVASAIGERHYDARKVSHPPPIHCVRSAHVRQAKAAHVHHAKAACSSRARTMRDVAVHGKGGKSGKAAPAHCATPRPASCSRASGGSCVAIGMLDGCGLSPK